MASLSSLPRRRVMVAPVGLLSSTSIAVISQRRNHWAYRHWRQAYVSRSRRPNPTRSHEETEETEPNKSVCWNHGNGGMRWGWWGWSGGNEGWRAQRWTFIRKLSSGGRDGGWDSWDKRLRYTPPDTKDSQKQDETVVDPITNRRVAQPSQVAEPKDEEIKSFLSDFLSPDYESRFVTWKEKEQKKLIEKLKKEFEEQERELFKRQKKDQEERDKREKKYREDEEKESRRFEDELKALEMEQAKEREKQREYEREKEREKERQQRNAENIKDETKTIPHSIPVLHPYSRVPINEKQIIDSDELTEGGRRKQVDRDAVAYREQKAQPRTEGVEELSPSLVVEAAGEGLVDPVQELEATSSPVGVEPLSGEGLTVTQASDSPVVILPATEKVAGKVPVTVLPNLSKDANLQEATQLGEEAIVKEDGDAPILVESAGGSGRGLRPVEPAEYAMIEPVEVSSPSMDGGPVIVPPPPSEAPAEEPPMAAAPPFPEPAPSLEPTPKVDDVLALPSAPEFVPSTLSVPESVTSELSQIKESLSQVTNVVTKLDSTMDYELNSILIQLRLWRREVEKLASTSSSIPPEQRKIFIEDVKEIPEANKQSQVEPMDYKILTLSPTPPFHLLTTNLNVANSGAWTVEGSKNVSYFLPKLKEPYLFLQHVPKLTAEGWELVSGGAEMLMFARKPVAGQLPSPFELDSNTKAIIPEPNTATEVVKQEPSQVKTVFESSSTGYTDSEKGTGILKGDKRLIYNLNNDRHLHLYGHGLGGIAGDGVSFSSVNVHPRVNPIDMTTHPELPDFPSSETSSSSSGNSLKEEEIDEERSRWDEKRTDAVRSMREGLALGEKAQVEANASAVEIVEDIEGVRKRAEEEERILAEIKAVDGAVHGEASLRDALAREVASAEQQIQAAAAAEEQEQSQQQKKKGGRVGRFFKRLGWTVVWLGAGVILVKEVGYWSERSEEKEVKTGGLGNDGLRQQQQQQVDGGEGWTGRVARPGSRYSWSERDSSRGAGGLERWGGPSGVGTASTGRTWGEESRSS